MPYESWVERLIREATERGEFDNLPGQGKPIKGLNGRDEENWWIKAYLEREQLPLPLPTSLALRKEVTELPTHWPTCRTNSRYARSSAISTIGSRPRTGSGRTVRRSWSGLSTSKLRWPPGVVDGGHPVRPFEDLRS